MFIKLSAVNFYLLERDCVGRGILNFQWSIEILVVRLSCLLLDFLLNNSEYFHAFVLSQKVDEISQFLRFSSIFLVEN